MSKILYSATSPYSAKVRMAAAYCGYEFQSIDTNTTKPEQYLLDVNPLAKIPVLITDQGVSIYDSRVITQFLNRESKGQLFPRSGVRRTEAEQLEALCDGICDSALAIVYEGRMRPEEFQYSGWIERQWSKVERALVLLDANMPGLPARIHAGHLAMRAMIAYLGIRFAGQWEKQNTKLLNWAKRFDAKFPELAAYCPKP